MPSHGSLTKAGKTRQSSPKRQYREGNLSKKGVPFHGKKKKNPRANKRRLYELRFILDKEKGNKQRKKK